VAGYKATDKIVQAAVVAILTPIYEAGKHGSRDKIDTDLASGGNAIAGFNFIKNGDDNADNTSHA
jgi:hypothetical protein